MIVYLHVCIYARGHLSASTAPSWPILDGPQMAPRWSRIDHGP